MPLIDTTWLCKWDLIGIQALYVRRCGEKALASDDDENGSVLGLRVSPGRSTQR